MKQGKSKYSEIKVIRELEAKGCVIKTAGTQYTTNKTLVCSDEKTATKFFINWMKHNHPGVHLPKFSTIMRVPASIVEYAKEYQKKSSYFSYNITQEEYEFSGSINTVRARNLGNKSLGKIDFLTKYCGYKLITQ